MKKEYVFPFDYKGHFDGIGPYHKHSEGLELRDYFAGQALAGMLADSKTLAAIKEVAEEDNKNPSETMASNCYELADAMLKERKKT